MKRIEKLAEVLKDFRFSDYEIKVLITLLTEGELTATELAEKSGIPRTSVYEAVKSLENKGIVESFGKPLRVKAISVERLIEYFSQKLKEKMDVISSSLREIEKKAKKETVSLLKGEIAYSAIESFLRDNRRAEVYGLAINDELKRIFEGFKDKISLNLYRKSDVVHGMIFGDSDVLIYTIVDNNPNVLLGSGDFHRFYREVVEMFKNKKPPEF